MTPAKQRKPSRRRSRELAVQAIYAAGVRGQEVQANPKATLDPKDLAHADVPYLRDCLQGLKRDSQRVDALLQAHSHRSPDTLGLTESAVLSLSLWELLQRPDVPPAVVIDEGVRLARMFCDPPSFKLVNGLLQAAAKEVRPGWSPGEKT